MNINLPIYKHIKITEVDPNTQTLVICDDDPKTSCCAITAPRIYETLEMANKNFYNGKKIIQKEETQDEAIYRFNFGLTIKATKQSSKAIYCFGLKTLEYKNNTRGFLEIKEKEFLNEQDYRCIFDGAVYLLCDLLESAYFNNCEFHNKLSSQSSFDPTQRMRVCNEVLFENCKFLDDVYLTNVVFGFPTKENTSFDNVSNINFKNSHFLKTCDFSSSIFKNSTDFDSTTFDECSDFFKCIFEKNTSFYRALFKKPINLSHALIKENLNLTSAKMDFTFYELKDFIEKSVSSIFPDDTDSSLETDRANERNRIANDFQDTFRLIKHILIKSDNILEASTYHKLELYAKEIGLIGVESRTIKTTGHQSRVKNLETIAKIVDKWQLAFYRHLSDHHTNLFKVLNHLIITISCCFVTRLLDDIQKWGNKLSETNQLLPFVILLGCAWVIKRKKNKNTILTLLSKNVLFIMLILVLIIAGHSLLPQDWRIQNIVPLIVSIILMSVPITLICIQSPFLRAFSALISYFIFLYFILQNIGDYLNISILLESNKSKTEGTISKIITPLYFLLQAIILWSFQKTARKNSIIPT